MISSGSSPASAASYWPSSASEPALSALAERSWVPVRLSVPSRTAPGPVEAAVYFICAEAVANVQKYAQAPRVDVEVRIQGGSVIVVVADDGVGGADPSAGSGLDGLRDRTRPSAAASRSTVRLGTAPASLLRSR